MRGRPAKEYAIYKGDEFIAIGTIKELVKKTGYSETTLRYSANGAYPHKILVKFKDGHDIWYRV